MENFCETLRVDDNLIFDEVHKIFKYTYENHTEILPVANILSCVVTTDIHALDKGLFHSEKIPGIGSIPFISDLKELAKAVRQNDIFLTTSFYNQEKNLIQYNKCFSAQSEDAYALSRKINRLAE